MGALQLVPEGLTPGNMRQITTDKLTRDQVADLLNRSLGGAFESDAALDDTLRISLAGAQEKTALLFHDEVWHRPTQTTPTTHILKLPLGVNSADVRRHSGTFSPSNRRFNPCCQIKANNASSRCDFRPFCSSPADGFHAKKLN